MTRTWGCIGATTLVVVVIWGAFTLGLRKNEAEKFAGSTCDPATMGIGSYKVENDTIKFIRRYSSFNDCLTSNFPVSKNLDKLRKYIDGAGFRFAGKIVSNKKIREIYIKNVDYEKGPRELLIIFDHKVDNIIKIKGFEWSSANWEIDGSRPNSPFKECLEYVKKCGVIFNG
jgi:hypothetical protein